MEDTRRLRSVATWTAVFGIAFGWVEAAVVIYLRRLYYPGGFTFPLQLAPQDIGLVEVLREAATIVMLVAVARLGARSGWGRFGLFAVAFGAWDIAFYGGLRLAIGWPVTFGDWDVLFLIPGIWTGPVWAPVLVSLCLVAFGAVLYGRGESGVVARPALRHWLLGAGSLIAIIGAFLANHAAVFAGGRPESFPTVLFLGGVVAGCVAFMDVMRAPAPSRG